MINFVKFNKYFLDKSWEWLNDREIKQMTNTSDFTKKDQLKWFKSIKKNNSYKIWGILLDKKPIGACGIKNIHKEKGEYWGYIGEKEEWGKGYGKEIINYIETKSKKMGIKNIYLKVIENNERAINLYTKMGFKYISKNNNIVTMEKQLNK